MVEAEAGDGSDQRPFDDVGGIEPTAKADFEDAGIGGGAGERQAGDGGRRLEEAWLDAFTDLANLAKQCREFGIFDQAAGDPDALVEADQMRAGEGMDLVAGGFERRPQEGAGRALAVGAGDMEEGGSWSCGGPSRSSRRTMRSSPSWSPRGESLASRSSSTWTAGSAERAKSPIRPPSSWPYPCPAQETRRATPAAPSGRGGG